MFQLPVPRGHVPFARASEGVPMAEEAFALSPISASSAVPTDADYEAIREAFMETSRGRWFLTEYARRNRNADTAMVLEAVTRIEQSLAAEAQSAAEVQPAPEPEGLPEAVRAALEQARATIRAEFSEAAFDHTFLPWRKSLRIIREVIWGLRESGSDPRICNILDGQVRAIEAACDEFPLDNICQQILAPINELLGDGEAVAEETSAALESDAITVAAPEIVAAPKTQAEAAVEAVAVEAIAETMVEAVADAELEVSLPEQAEAMHTQPAAPEVSAPVEAATTESVDTVALEAEATDIATVDATLDMDAAPAMAADAVSETPEAAAVPQPASEAAAQQAIAPEVATPEPVHVEAETPRPVTILNASASPQTVAQPMAEPEPARETAVHATAASLPKVDPTNVEAATAASNEPVATEDDLWADIEAEIAPLPALENGASLGATLIAQGVVRPSAATADLLAPIRRMSHAERIAFFS
ncbi:hypothetical protein CRBSH125_10370 [Afipia carboxidovorans]|nr:hypothetical protein CRBSH125_10370 [Afipia carboxidovorans]